MSKVSVLVPSYNCAHYLPQALDSALGQTFTDFEILVIDDGSTDNTRAVVEEYRKRHPDKIRYIHQENQGLACARNAGLRNARGEYIALLDADDQWLPERLEAGVRAIEIDNRIGLVHSDTIIISKEGEPLKKKWKKKYKMSGHIFLSLFLRKTHISCPTVLFRKECCARVGLFDENLTRLGCEDRELWLRIAQKYTIVYINKILACYRVSKSSMSRDKYKMLKARLYIVDKFYPGGSGGKIFRRLALAKIYRDSGDVDLLDCNFDDSKKSYRRSLLFWPFSLWPWVNLLKALLHSRKYKQGVKY